MAGGQFKRLKGGKKCRCTAEGPPIIFNKWSSFHQFYLSGSLQTKNRISKTVHTFSHGLVHVAQHCLLSTISKLVYAVNSTADQQQPGWFLYNKQQNDTINNQKPTKCLTGQGIGIYNLYLYGTILLTFLHPGIHQGWPLGTACTQTLLLDNGKWSGSTRKAKVPKDAVFLPNAVT